MRRHLTAALSTGALVVTMAVSTAGSAGADVVDAVYDSHTGTVALNGAATIAAAVATDDSAFVQLGPDSSLTMVLPPGYYAVPDGSTAPDLSVRIFDAAFPALADLELSYDGATWTSVGRYDDTADIDLDLWGPAKYVRVVQPELCSPGIANSGYCIDQAFPQLGFDLNAVVALNAMDVSSGGFVTGGGWFDSPPGAMPTVADRFANGFETDIDGWFTPTRVASGTNGVTSADGAWHAETGGAGPFTRWGGYTSTFPTGGYTTSLDIYLDVDAGLANDTRFDWSSAISTPAGGHRRDFVFNAGFYDDATGPGAGTDRYVISASPNATRSSSYPKNPGRDPISIDTSGWYTFQHRFYDSGGGVLAVDLSILDDSGTVIHTWTLSDPTDVIGSTVGGNRYGWFATDEGSGLAIDNSRLTVVDPGPTGPASFGFVSKYRKGATTPSGNTEFQFQAGDLNFHASTYDWLVVNRGGTNAQFKGDGSVNGVDGYTFMLWAGDSDPDTFRIKIWEESTGDTVYDNGVAQAISQGQIVIHTAKK